MSPDAGAIARDQLRDWRRRLPGLLRAASSEAILPAVHPSSLAGVWTTGIGSSAGHARYLSEVLSRYLGLPARFASTGRLASAAPSGARAGTLVVFSQGLSKNARFALKASERWAEVFLVTAVGSEVGARDPRDSERKAALERFRSAGVRVVSFLEEPEFGTLVRVAGPMLGYAAALRLARGFAERLGRRESVPAFDSVRVAETVASAAARFDACDFDEAGVRSLARGIVLVASGGYGEAIENLRTKVLEGVGCSAPPVWDLLEFAHGGFQEVFDREATVVALSCKDAGEAPSGGFRALASMLDADRHRLVGLHSAQPLATAVFEHEAFFDSWLERWLELEDRNPASWPGQDRDGPLYDRVPEVGAGAREPERPTASAVLESSTWPEIESLELFETVAVIALGSTEQHGAHLSFGTDTAIAEALAEGFCARVPEALRLPVLALGCADEHLGFAGTLSLRQETLEAVIEDVLGSLRDCGFGRAFVFSAHGGNVEALGRMAPGQVAAARPLKAIFFDGWDQTVDASHALALEEGISPEAAGHHAGEVETSILESIAPDLVRREHFEVGRAASRVAGAALFDSNFRTAVPSGVVGDPTRAEAARGSRYLEHWVDDLVSCYRAAKEREKKRHQIHGTKNP